MMFMLLVEDKFALSLFKKLLFGAVETQLLAIWVRWDFKEYANVK